MFYLNGDEDFFVQLTHCFNCIAILEKGVLSRQGHAPLTHGLITAPLDDIFHILSCLYLGD